MYQFSKTLHIRSKQPLEERELQKPLNPTSEAMAPVTENENNTNDILDDASDDGNADYEPEVVENEDEDFEGEISDIRENTKLVFDIR